MPCSSTLHLNAALSTRKQSHTCHTNIMLHTFIACLGILGIHVLELAAFMSSGVWLSLHQQMLLLFIVVTILAFCSGGPMSNTNHCH
jgi:hypothetical protein